MSTSNIQALLRFLAQEAKLPLSLAISKVPALQQAGLSTIEDLSKLKPNDAKLTAILPDEKHAKQVISAAKRSLSKSKKRPADSAAAAAADADVSGASSRSKAKKARYAEAAVDSTAVTVPRSQASEDELAEVKLVTNRAPLMLAFIFVLLGYTRPALTEASRLSLAQGYVGAASRARAISLGIESGSTAEELGFGEGWPIVKVLGRDVRVLRRWGDESGSAYEDAMNGSKQRQSDATDAPQFGPKDADRQSDSEEKAYDQKETSQSNPSEAEILTSEDQEPTSPEPTTLWALDLEAVRQAKERGTTLTGDKMPIHTPQSARAYLAKAFESIDNPIGSTGTTTTTTNPDAKTSSSTRTARSSKPQTVAEKTQRENNLGLLLRALELLYESWRGLSPEELEARTWIWYERVRPYVLPGAAGWGGRGELKLRDILALRKTVQAEA